MSVSVTADQLLLTTNPTSTSRLSAVDSVEMNKQTLWDQLDEVCSMMFHYWMTNRL